MSLEWEIRQGHVLDLLRAMPSESVQTCVTSPPYYGLRDYGIEPQTWPDGWVGSLGLEPSLPMYIEHLVEIFREVRRVLRSDGTAWVNMGDSYVAGPTGHQDISNANGKAAAMFAKGGRYRVDNMRKDVAQGREHGRLKPKDLMMVPARLAIALVDDGWYLRSAITWCKRAPMPESVKDRPTSATEMIYLLSKSERYYYDADAVRVQGPGSHPRGSLRSFIADRKDNDRDILESNPAGRNLWNWWDLSPEAYPEAHFATFPKEIPRRCILAGTSARGACPACGKGWVRVVERTLVPTQRTNGASKWKGDNDAMARPMGSDTLPGGYNKTDTLGWQPACSCNAGDPVPCTVLDIFSGAATTGVVALQLGRRYIGLELQPQYVEMGTRRILREGVHQTALDLVEQMA